MFVACKANDNMLHMFNVHVRKAMRACRYCVSVFITDVQVILCVRPSVVQFHGVKDIHRSQDEGYTSPTTLSPTYHMHASAKEDNDDDLGNRWQDILTKATSGRNPG